MASAINLFYTGFTLIMIAGLANILLFHSYSESSTLDLSSNLNLNLESHQQTNSYDTEDDDGLPQQQQQQQQQQDTTMTTRTDFDIETAIVITTNLIPSHPSLGMLNETITSCFTHLKGLSPHVPIYITVDPLKYRGYKEGREKTWSKEGKEREEEEERLEAYVTALYDQYENQSNYHILVNTMNVQIGASFAKAVQLLDDSKTKFVYYVQHDFKFVDDIDHIALVKTMKEYPNVLRLVRFHKRPITPSARSTPCWNRTDAVNSVNGIHFTSTNQWSDNNHFSTVTHYKEIFDKLTYLRRPLEAPMQLHAMNNCTYWGPHIYGAPYEGPHIEHLDGRLGYGIENATLRVER